MIPNRLKALWTEGKPTINGWCSIGNPFTAEIMAAQGFDSVTVDMQHGALDYSALLPMFQAMQASGAFGIICPMVNTADEAARFVRYLRYPPLGTRSFGPTRVAFSAGANYAAEANGNILGFAMIETAEGMANLDAIAATPGLDGIYVGPSDLSLSLSQGKLAAGMDREEPEMIAALQTILAACKKNGLRAALHCGSPDYAGRAIGWGYDMTTVGGDTRFLAAAAGAAVAQFRTLTGGRATSAEKGGY